MQRAARDCRKFLEARGWRRMKDVKANVAGQRPAWVKGGTIRTMRNAERVEERARRKEGRVIRG